MTESSVTSNDYTSIHKGIVSSKGSQASQAPLRASIARRSTTFRYGVRGKYLEPPTHFRKFRPNDDVKSDHESNKKKLRCGCVHTSANDRARGILGKNHTGTISALRCCKPVNHNTMNRLDFMQVTTVSYEYALCISSTPLISMQSQSQNQVSKFRIPFLQDGWHQQGAPSRKE